MKEFFEFADILKQPFERKTWIPIYAGGVQTTTGKYGFYGYKEEYFEAISIIIDQNMKTEALDIQWLSANPSNGNNGWVNDNDEYIPSNRFYDWKQGIEGSYLVLNQILETGDNNVWHLDQDLVTSLNLLRKNDTWISPKVDYIEVARLSRNKNGEPKFLEIKAEYLKDYLCARKKGLLIATFRSRTHIYQDEPNFVLLPDNSIKQYDWGIWSGYINAIHEGGFPYGEKIDILRASRTDIDFNDDVPQLNWPSDKDVEINSFELKHIGKKLYRVHGELWKNYWITPGTKSPRIKGDKIESTLPFFIDNEGKTANSSELIHIGKWLWFKPTIIREILNKIGGFLNWYTENTGSIGTASTWGVHFGVNKIGLVNVYAKDIAQLPEWLKRTWVSHNLAPDGGISEELLMAQVKVSPAKTHAPEISLFENIIDLDERFNKKYGNLLFRPHTNENHIKKNIHRFTSTNLEGFLLLSKEITRYIIERIDIDVLKKLYLTQEKLGSIKRLERILSKESLDGRKLTAPLIGVYELRKADAHLSNNNFQEALGLVGFITLDKNYIENGKRLIETISACIASIAQALR